MRVVVPFDAATPKTRLEDTLEPAERADFAQAMLADVLGALQETGAEPEVLSTGHIETEVPVMVDERPLTQAVNAVLADASAPIAVVMADLALSTPRAFARLLDAPGDVVLVPGRGGGTNALVARHPDFRVDYHGVSIRDHRETASAIGASVTEIDSARLSTDIDERADLPEVLLRGRGRATDWLRQRFAITVTDGRVGVKRRSSQTDHSE